VCGAHRETERRTQERTETSLPHDQPPLVGSVTVVSAC